MVTAMVGGRVVSPALVETATVDGAAVEAANAVDTICSAVEGIGAFVVVVVGGFVGVVVVVMVVVVVVVVVDGGMVVVTGRAQETYW